jgi:GTP-binding protein
MLIKQAEFFTTVVAKDQYPTEGIKEIAFVGRSNVGKSSLINLLTNNKKLAKTSGNPGKTRTINYFLINNSFYFVDLPGYGYAKVPKDLQASWGRMMEQYLIDREELKVIIVLVDIRHKPSKGDENMMEFIKHYDIPFIVAATKADKISRGQRAKYLKVIKESLGLDYDSIVACSTLDRTGIAELLSKMDEYLDSDLDIQKEINDVEN